MGVSTAKPGICVCVYVCVRVCVRACVGAMPDTRVPKQLLYAEFS